MYPCCSTQWAKGYTFFFLPLSNIFPRRNDGNGIYTNRILMECLRNKDPQYMTTFFIPNWGKYCCLLISIIILYYQKVVNLPFFVTEKAQTKAFTMIYKQKVVILPLFVTFPFSRSPKKWHYLSQTFSQEETMAIVFIQIGF